MAMLIESQLFESFGNQFGRFLFKFHRPFGLGWGGRGNATHLLHLWKDFLDDGGGGWGDQSGGLR